MMGGGVGGVWAKADATYAIAVLQLTGVCNRQIRNGCWESYVHAAGRVATTMLAMGWKIVGDGRSGKGGSQFDPVRSRGRVEFSEDLGEKIGEVSNFTPLTRSRRMLHRTLLARSIGGFTVILVVEDQIEQRKSETLMMIMTTSNDSDGKLWYTIANPTQIKGRGRS